jgi:hypothetical protein
MRWVAAPAVGLAILAFSSNVNAGDYHRNGNLLCAQCHIMHYSQSHGYSSSGGGFYLNPGAGGPFEFLLRDEINNLCLACHDQAGVAPDVLGVANGGNSPTDIRLAGYLNRLGIEGQAATGHTLDSLATAPGSNPPWKPEDDNGAGKGLNCVNCHHQHGFAGGGANNAYRNLRRDPGNLTSTTAAVVTYNDTQIGTFDATKDVFERQAAEYSETVVDWAEPDTTTSKIAQWCGGCHTNFHGTPGDSNIGGIPGPVRGYIDFIRHPVGGVNIGDQTGGHSSLTTYAGNTAKVKVMSASGDWTGATPDVTPTCISCHKAHGNGNAFGLIYRKGLDTSITENGSPGGTQLEHLCGQCHGQASFFR